MPSRNPRPPSSICACSPDRPPRRIAPPSAAKRSLDLSQEKYAQGSSDYLDVLDSQRTLLQSELSSAQLYDQRLQSYGSIQHTVQREAYVMAFGDAFWFLCWCLVSAAAITWLFQKPRASASSAAA